MKIETVVDVHETNVKPFPKVMIGKDDPTFVFFAESGCGLILKSASNVRVGSFFSTFDMKDFKDFSGEITIKITQ